MRVLARMLLNLTSDEFIVEVVVTRSFVFFVYVL